jgi:dUTP pyrophosphatase
MMYQSNGPVMGDIVINKPQDHTLMKICPHAREFQLPTLGTDGAGAFDVYMPTAGRIEGEAIVTVDLGFSAEVPPGYVALLLPRSGSGGNFGVELRNTCGVIDSDYRGPWKAKLQTKKGEEFGWAAGDRVIQFVIVPVLTPELQVVDQLDATLRGNGGFGSTGR